MEKEWFKWKKGTGAEEHVDYDETWYDGDWVQDWSQPSEAWDRYATLDGAVSKHTLGNQPKEQEPSEKPEERQFLRNSQESLPLRTLPQRSASMTLSRTNTRTKRRLKVMIVSAQPLTTQRARSTP